jgi:hypothetical protein
MYQQEGSLSQLAGLVLVTAVFSGLLVFLGPGLPSWFPLLGGRSASAVAAEGVDLGASPSAAQPAGPPAAPYCQPGQPPALAMGFARLKAEIGAEMGEPLECEHGNPDNGDTLQRTSTGLAVFEASTGLLRFTDGWQHWALIGDDLVAWEGDDGPTALRNLGASSVPGS